MTDTDKLGAEVDQIIADEPTYHVCNHGMRVDFHCFDCERVAAKLNISTLMKQREDARKRVETLVAILKDNGIPAPK